MTDPALMLECVKLAIETKKIEPSPSSVAEVARDIYDFIHGNGLPTKTSTPTEPSYDSKYLHG